MQDKFARETEKTSTIFSHLAKVALLRGLTSEWSTPQKIAVFREMLMEASKPRGKSLESAFDRPPL
jgi:hypothetical protein